MKKKLFLVIVSLLCMTMLLSSCGSLFGKKNDELSFNSVINKDWTDPDTEEKVLTMGQQMSFADGSFNKANGRYVVITNYDVDTMNTDSVTYVYDHTMGSTPILTLTDTSVPVYANDSITNGGYYQNKITSHYVDLINDDYFAVFTVVYDYTDHYAFSDYYNSYNYTFNSNVFGMYNLPVKSLLEQQANNLGVTLTASYQIDIYEKNGTVPVKTVDTATLEDWAENSTGYNNYDIYFDNQYSNTIEDYDAAGSYDTYLGFDLYVRDNAVYRVDEDGNETLVREFGISKIPSEIDYETEKYYIVKDYDVVNYYNKSLEPVFSYVAPMYNYNMDTLINVLNDGKLLVQYTKALHTDAKKYDYRTAEDSMNKYSLTTLLVDPENGEETELDADYIVMNMEIAYTADPADNYYAEGIENIAYVYYIDDDKMIDFSSAAVDWVSMSNDGEIMGSVKFDSTLKEIPYAIGGGYFCASNVRDEYVIFTADGTVVNTLNEHDDLFYNLKDDRYVETDDAIYAIDGTKVYDLKEKNAEDVEWLNNGSFIVSYKANGVMNYDLVVDGYVKSTHSLSPVTTLINRVDAVGSAMNGNAYYVRTLLSEDMYNNSIYEYKYYNANGELIGTFSEELYYTVTEDSILAHARVKDAASGEYKLAVYKFDFTEIN